MQEVWMIIKSIPRHSSGYVNNMYWFIDIDIVPTDEPSSLVWLCEQYVLVY